MTTPARILRAAIADIPGAMPDLPPREQARFNTIIKSGQRVLAQHGRVRVSFQNLAAALVMSSGTLRRYFGDIDHLLAEILLRHLRTIMAAVQAVPAETPDRGAACRAAYLAATRTGDGALTEAHLLLVRDRHHLPPDEIGAITQLRSLIAEAVAGADGVVVLNLLDMPELSGETIEAVLAGLRVQAGPGKSIVQAAPMLTSIAKPVPGAVLAPTLQAASAAFSKRQGQPHSTGSILRHVAGAPAWPPPSANNASLTEEWRPPSLYETAIEELAKAGALAGANRG